MLGRATPSGVTIALSTEEAYDILSRLSHPAQNSRGLMILTQTLQSALDMK